MKRIIQFLNSCFLSLFFGLFFTSLYGSEAIQKVSGLEKIEVVSSTYSDIKIGILSGTFDPPTKAHNAVIRSALENLGLERLYIFVNKNGEKQYKCSSQERVEMLKRMLKDVADKVVIIAQFSDSKRADYYMIKSILIQDKVIHIVGEDSYERRLLIFPENRIQFDAVAIIPRIGQEIKKSELESNAFYLPINNKEMLGVSSTKVRAQLAARDYWNIALTPEVLSYIIENHLYIHNDNDTRKELFFKEYYAYIGYLFSKGELSASCPPPAYDDLASESSWTEAFYKWVNIHQKKV